MRATQGARQPGCMTPEWNRLEDAQLALGSTTAAGARHLPPTLRPGAADTGVHPARNTGQPGAQPHHSLAYPFSAVQDAVLAGRHTPSPGDAYTAARHPLRNRRG